VPTAISLFAGCGGDTLGLLNAGYDVLGFIENWKPAVESHRLNFPNEQRIGESVGGDIRAVPDDQITAFEGRVDLLFGGFPCQGFSHAGKKDPNDPRNRLFWRFVHAASLIRPRWIVGENVSGLLHRSTDDGVSPVSEVIVEAFESAGFRMTPPFVLNAADFGVPQQRRRVFFVGSRDNRTFSAPRPMMGPRGGTRKKHWIGIRSSLDFTLEGAVSFDPSRVAGTIPSYLEHPGRDVPTGSPHPYLLAKLEAGLLSASKRDSPFHVEVANLDAPAKTIHSGYSFQPRLFVPLRNAAGTFLRPFTTLELARLQGFPRGYQLAGRSNDIIVQIGNAVPPPLAEAVARRILACDPELSSGYVERSSLRAWAESAPTP